MHAVNAAADAEQVSTRFAPGATLAERFVLRRPLASGGSGEVWVATNRATRGLVALKLVHRASPLAAARFRQEAALSAALAHRNVVRVFDYFEDRGGPLGLVMECLRGETARERLERAGPCSPRAAVAVATQVLAGLAHAHEHNIVHRDIKPPNLFLATDPDGSTTTKILDFGIARTPTNTVHTLHGQLLGTPRYMSPEQIRAEPTLDGRSDIFSLAAVIYELVAGRPLFEAPFATASLARVLESKPARDERIPEALWHVLEKALSKDPGGRFPTAKAFADALRVSVVAGDGALALELHRSRPPPPMLPDDDTSTDAIVLAHPPSSIRPRTKTTLATRLGPRKMNALVAVVSATAALVALFGLRALTTPREPIHAPAIPVAAAPALPPPIATSTPTSTPTPTSAASAPASPELPTPASLTQPTRPASASPHRPAPPPAPPPKKPAAILRNPGF